jgi:hypothetical protein
MLLFAFGVSLTSVYANEAGHDDEEETSMVTADSNDTPQIVKMKQVISILKQLIELYKQKAALSSGEVAETSHHDEEETDELKIWVEVHSYKTHAHVQRPNATVEAFVFEDIEYTDEDAVIEALAEKTGFSVHDIEEIITFPEGELNAKGDSVEEAEEGAEEDVTGIHIMSDGKIMWGNGTEVHGATLTTDGKVKLSDGRIITPKFDLR